MRGCAQLRGRHTSTWALGVRVKGLLARYPGRASGTIVDEMVCVVNERIQMGRI
jgi:hypothetical protein